VRNSGVHAAGVVISPRPLTDLVPLHRTKNDEIVTAFDMVAIEKMGLLKMDFLGLTTLTILTDALKLILQTRGTDHARTDSARRCTRPTRKFLQRADLRRLPV
jgi:DNA polymerase III subunit alpha